MSAVETVAVARIQLALRQRIGCRRRAVRQQFRSDESGVYRRSHGINRRPTDSGRFVLRKCFPDLLGTTRQLPGESLRLKSGEDPKAWNRRRRPQSTANSAAPFV